MISQTRTMIPPRAQRTAAAVVTEDIPPIDGSCGGSITGTVTADDEANDFSANITISEFCEELDGTETATLNGALSFSGSGDPATDNFQLSSSASGITVETDEESLTIAYQIAVNVVGTAGAVSIPTLIVTNNDTGQVYQIQNLNLTATEGADTTEVQVSGRFSNSEEGAVEIATLQPVVISDTDGEVVSGEVQFTGDGGTTAVVTLAGGGVFGVGADTNGDGTDDFFEDLDCSGFDLGLEL